MKVLGLDVGDKRIGYAISDESLSIAFPRETFSRKPDEKCILTVRNIVKLERISRIVIGIPLDEDNEETSRSKKIRTFGDILARNIMLPIDYVDEFNSTREALSKMPLRKDRRTKGRDDSIAAQIILQRYLNGE